MRDVEDLPAVVSSEWAELLRLDRGHVLHPYGLGRRRLLIFAKRASPRAPGSRSLRTSSERRGRAVATHASSANAIANRSGDAVVVRGETLVD
jgi:hypothetical protein